MTHPNPFKVGDTVYHVHAWDGSARAGLTEGPPTQITAIRDHQPKDGPPAKDAVCFLRDGSWRFYWCLSAERDR